MSSPFYSIDAEEALIGGALKYPQIFDELCSNVIAPDFYSQTNKKIWQEIEKLHKDNKIFDHITISSHMHNQVKAEILYSWDKGHDEDQVINFSKIVRNLAIKREIKAKYEMFVKNIDTHSHNNISDLISQAEKTLNEAEDRLNSVTKYHTYDTSIPLVLENIKERASSAKGMSGLPTGIKELDKMTLGYKPGQLIIVAGRPAMGKTTMALGSIEAIMEEGGRAVVFSMEMSAEELTEKSLSSQGRINFNSISSGRFTELENARLPKVIKKLADLDIVINDSVDLTLSEARAQILRCHREKPVDVVMFDYLQLMKLPKAGPNETRAMQIGDLSRGLKMLAKELGIPVIVLSQLSRKVEERADKRPMPSDLRDSGSIEQDADLIVFLYRDEVYDPGTRDKGIAEIIIGKQRKGKTGTIKVKFEGEYSTFSDIVKDESEFLDTPDDEIVF